MNILIQFELIFNHILSLLIQIMQKKFCFELQEITFNHCSLCVAAICWLMEVLQVNQWIHYMSKSMWTPQCYSRM